MNICDLLYEKGPFPQNSNCELHLLVDSTKTNASASHLQVTVLQVSYSQLPWLRDICGYFSPVAKRQEFTPGSRYMHVYNVWPVIAPNQAAADGSPSRLCQCVVAIVV